MKQIFDNQLQMRHFGEEQYYEKSVKFPGPL